MDFNTQSGWNRFLENPSCPEKYEPADDEANDDEKIFVTLRIPRQMWNEDKRICLADKIEFCFTETNFKFVF